jgi:nitrite reductase (NADH) small subunit
MPQYVTVARVSELAEGAAKTVEAGGKLVALFRQRSGWFAIDDVCPHMGASLAQGTVEQEIVTCPWHAWRFRLTDGCWADNPRLKIGCYRVRIVGDEVQVEI